MTTMAVSNEDAAVRQRLDMFKLGGPTPMPSGARSGHRHQRSHSRNASITSSSSLSLSSLASSRSSGLNDLSGFTFGGLNSSASSGSCASGNSSLSSSTSSASNNSALPPSKRNSHHRRKSSVSTRRESAELMGVSLPDLPPTSEYGDKDSIRRRALWALEGKPDVAFNKVEIPELSTPDMDKMMFDLSSKLGLSSAPSSSGFGNSLMASKRDSFKLLASSGSSKDQLHTLLEEEEEDEDEEPVSQKPAKSADDAIEVSSPEEHATFAASIAISKPAPSRGRPATLNLRPLSLVPATTVVQGLPTPSLSPTRQPGLRSFSLNTCDDSPLDAKQTRRDSVNFLTNARRAALGARNASMDSTSSSDEGSKPSRRSSICYKTSGSTSFNAAGLPTPEMTPTFSRRTSLSEINQVPDDEFFLGGYQQSAQKPLSASEQHFLLKSHKTLVARITDLERALSRRVSMGGYSSSSRPSSVISDVTLSESGSSSSVPGEPNDEMLAFIRDLKAERDELKKDVEGWRTRVNDLDRKHALLAKRVETERWEAWSARSHAGILESEKAGLEKRIEELDKTFAELESDKASLLAANRELQAQNDEKTRRIEQLEEELERVKNELRKEQESHQHQSRAIGSSSMDSDLLATPTPGAFLAQSPSSTASVYLGLGLPDDQAEDAQPFGFGSNGVTESYSEVDSDDENGLAGYEDEEDFDGDCTSFGSGNDSPEQDCYSDEEDTCDVADVVDSYVEAAPAVPARPESPLRGELSSTWSFPRARSAPAAAFTEPAHKKHQSSDRFFNCLDESDATDDSAPSTPVSFNYEQSKDLFARGFKFAAEDDAPFFFPPGIGILVDEPVIESKSSKFLMPLAEVEEEEEDEVSEDNEDLEDDTAIFGEELGGIRITFTPPDFEESEDEPEQIQFNPPVKSASPPPVLPDLNFGFGADEDENFMFGLSSSTSKSSPSTSVQPPEPSADSSLEIITPPTPPPVLPQVRSASPRMASPSSIPRPISRQSTSSVADSPSRKSTAVPFPVYTTPPAKRSYIPQASPSQIRSPSSFKSRSPVSPPTFIRPPSTRITPVANKTQLDTRSANGSAFTPQPPLNHTSKTMKSQWQGSLTRSRK